MSTPQQPGGGQESYAQPQDPWAGQYEPGLASVPTDPIPQQPGPYAQTQPADVWSQPTVPHGAPAPQYPYVPQQAPRRGGAGVVVLVILLIVVLGGGGGFAAYKVLTAPTGKGNPSPSTSTTPAASATPTVPEVFPYTVHEGDCVFNAGTAQSPLLQASDCSKAGSYKIVKIARGASIPRAADGTFDRDTTANAVCAGVTYQTWYGYQTGKPALDLFFCMTNNP